VIVIRIAASAALLVTAGLVAAQLFGWLHAGDNLNGTTLGLLLIVLASLIVATAPAATRAFLERLTTVKLPGGLEIGLQAVNRAERVQGGLSESFEDPLRASDDVTVKQRRPLEGDARQQFQAVQRVLQARLRFVHTVVLGLPRSTESDYPQVLREIDDEHLLNTDESALVRDLLGRAENQVEKLEYDVRNGFLDAAWQFAVRFASLSHERLVRQRLAKRGCVLMDLEQDRAHRPDFLAYRNEAWLMVAARVLPGNLDGTRKRLNQTPPPFDAVPVIAIPDKKSFTPDGKYSRVKVCQLTQLTECAGAL
jgi:hypothetical protein